MHKTSAWPLALAYTALIVYASLYPFDGWRFQGIAPWAFLTAPWPRYWSGFDVVTNVLGYGPLGFFLALSVLRSQAPRPGQWPAVVMACCTAAGLSLLMETLQVFLPSRVASNVDAGLNLLGAGLGAVLAWSLERLGALDRWSRFRARWFVADARGALVLLALWPTALLFPAPVPFGLGQVLERLEQALSDWLVGTPFLEWIPLREMELQPLLPGAELLAVLLGALLPCLLGYSVIRQPLRRAIFALLVMGVGLGVSALSAALSWGPAHAWAWLGVPVSLGLGAALLCAWLALWLPRPACVALLLLALCWHLGVLNNASTGAYFAQTLHTWEQGKFIRFHGLAQWLGWLWPYGVLAYALGRMWQRPAPESGSTWGRN